MPMWTSSMDRTVCSRSPVAAGRSLSGGGVSRWVAVCVFAIAGVATAAMAQESDDVERIEVDYVTGLADPNVGFINTQLAIGWRDNEVTPSPLADDGEWMRRVCLDLAGRIPTLAEVEAFLADKSETKRADLIETLLNDPAFIDRFADQWTTLLIGRQEPQRTDRDAMHKFLRDQIATEQPWNEIVFRLMTAEGRFDENGATNFLLSKLDGNPRDEDYHVEATAAVTRLFLGMQVQCTQCHNHPFNDWQQKQFWQFNSFMRQIERNDVRQVNPETGQNEDLYSELRYRDYSGPVYFEKRSGLMQVAYPTYFGEEIDRESDDRRGTLAAFLRDDSDGGQRIAKAFVNRTWSQLFGYGFTRPVDDMGPHNPPSHPDLLDGLASRFVDSGYDVRSLVRWIVNSKAYNLTSVFNRDGSNQYDKPSAGETPLFSHMYVKTLSAEQLYDSLATATGADQTGDWDAAQQRRTRWLREFVTIFGGSESEEPTLFSGTIPQALLMMNGRLMDGALEGEPGSVLRGILENPDLDNDRDRVRALYLAALTRVPSSRESSGIVSMLSQFRTPADKLVAYQDLYWALLNSNEFIFNH